MVRRTAIATAADTLPALLFVLERCGDDDDDDALLELLSFDDDDDALPLTFLSAFVKTITYWIGSCTRFCNVSAICCIMI